MNIQNYLPGLLITGALSLMLCSCKQATTAARQSMDTAGALKQKTAADSTHLVGVWLDEGLKLDKGQKVAYEILTSGPKAYIQVITFTSSKLNINDNPDIAPGATEIKKSSNKYIGVANPNETYTLDKAGNLLIYDETGLIMTCKKML